MIKHLVGGFFYALLGAAIVLGYQNKDKLIELKDKADVSVTTTEPRQSDNVIDLRDQTPDPVTKEILKLRDVDTHQYKLMEKSLDLMDINNQRIIKLEESK